VATWVPGEGLDALLERTDRALYAAKAAGRNCIRAAAPVRRIEMMPIARPLTITSARG
jgi:predicted signal transduction protein with EAL and GGDEF domain